MSSFSRDENHQKLVIIKFVTRVGFGQLYNLKIENLPTQDWLISELEAHTNSEVMEYWACTSIIKQSYDNFSGRYLVDLSYNRLEILEMIWWTSPRLLESNLQDSIFPYSCHVKKPGQLIYRTEQTILPYGINLEPSQMHQCFLNVLNLISENKYCIELFESILEKCGLSVYSLEFKFEDGTGRFIDWDTGNDKKFLSQFPV